MITLYLSENGLQSCVGSEKWAEILGYLQRAGVHATRRQIRQVCGYWFIELAGDRHLAALKAAHAGIPRLNYRDLAHLSIRLLSRRFGQRWIVKDRRQLNVDERARQAAARREIRQLELRRGL